MRSGFNIFLHVEDNPDGTYCVEELWPYRGPRYIGTSAASALDSLLGISKKDSPTDAIWKKACPDPIAYHTGRLEGEIMELRTASDQGYSSRELSLAITRLEEALSWIKKANQAPHSGKEII